MALDPKLREVLDSLSEEPAKARPKEEREYLVSVLRRLNIRDVPKAAEPPAPADPNAAFAREEELRRLREQQERDEETLQAIQAERDALRARQSELESRLARLEAGNQGGLSYVDEEPEPVVEFTRVDFPPRAHDDELMEFESVPEQASAFAAPDAGAWSEPAWETEPGWSQEAAAPVDWDDDAEGVPATPRPAPAEDPLAASWDDSPAPPTPAPAAADELDELDDRTKSDLAELEAQLAELERELAKREETARRRTD